MGTCKCLPHHGGPWAPLPWSHPPISPDFTVFSTRTQGRRHYKASGLNQTATTTTIGASPGKIHGTWKEGHKLADQWGPRSQPQRKRHSSAHRVRKGTLPPAGKSHCRVLPGLEKGPASQLLTEAGLQSASGVSMPVTGSLSALQGMWSLHPSPQAQPHLP